MSSAYSWTTKQHFTVKVPTPPLFLICHCKVCIARQKSGHYLCHFDEVSGLFRHPLFPKLFIFYGFCFSIFIILLFYLFWLLIFLVFVYLFFPRSLNLCNGSRYLSMTVMTTKIYYGTTSFLELITAKAWKTASGCPPCMASAVCASTWLAKTGKVMSPSSIFFHFCFRCVIMRKSPDFYPHCIPQQMNCLTGYGCVQRFVSRHIDIVLIFTSTPLFGR